MDKEEAVLGLFLDMPTKHWHFEEILRNASISRPQAFLWLKKFVKNGLVKHIKPRGRMPYFQADFDSPAYRSRKRIFALEHLQKSGFIDHLLSLPKAKTVIIFGSFVRADWYLESDIDIFIYGSDYGLSVENYRKLLKHDIQIFLAQNTLDLEKFGPGLLRNILEGVVIKGKIDFVEVTPIAAI